MKLLDSELSCTLPISANTLKAFLFVLLVLNSTMQTGILFLLFFCTTFPSDLYDSKPLRFSTTLTNRSSRCRSHCDGVPAGPTFHHQSRAKIKKQGYIGSLNSITRLSLPCSNASNRRRRILLPRSPALLFPVYNDVPGLEGTTPLYIPDPSAAPPVFSTPAKETIIVKTHQPTVPEMSNSDSSLVIPTNSAFVAMMPRSGQPGAMELFDGANITDYLEDWNFLCDEYHYDDTQKSARFPNYCIPDVKDVVKLLPGYIARDWTQMQTDVKQLYWQHDKPRNTIAALNDLIRTSSENFDLNVYILRYTSITDALVEQLALSPVDRVTRLFDGLPDDLQRRVMKFCMHNSWRISSYDAGKSLPDFKAIKNFLLIEARAAQNLVVYEKDRASRVLSSVVNASPPSSSSLLSSPASSSLTPTTSMPTTLPDSVTEFSKQLCQMTSMLQTVLTPSSTATSSFMPRPFDRIPRCVFCDSTEHRRSQCLNCSDALGRGLVYFNEKGHIVNAATGEEIPLMYRHGGMKKVLESFQSFKALPLSFNNNTVIAHGPYNPS
jgi:hypothetical protein